MIKLSFMVVLIALALSLFAVTASAIDNVVASNEASTMPIIVAPYSGAGSVSMINDNTLYAFSVSVPIDYGELDNAVIEPDISNDAKRINNVADMQSNNFERMP